MWKRRGLFLAVIAFLWLLWTPGAARAGGCCLVVSVDQLPDAIVAGEPVEIPFTTRFAGSIPLSFNWRGEITAVHLESGETFSAAVESTEAAGHYAVTLTFPQAGIWRWTVNGRPMPPLYVQAAQEAAAGQTTDISLGIAFSQGVAVVGSLAAVVAGLAWFLNRTRPRLALMLAAVLVAGVGLAARPLVQETAVSAVPAIAPEEMGPALFVAKGCTTCHIHEGIPYAQNMLEVGPNLTHYAGSPDFLRQWLSDPKSVRPDTIMPNLELSSEEIEALVTLLSAAP